MNKKFYSLLSMALFGSAWLMAQPTELAIDGGFEEASQGTSTAPGWMLSGPADTVTYTIISGSHSGNNALQAVVINRELIYKVSDWTIQVVDEGIVVNPDTYYRFSVWTKADAANRKVNLTIGDPSYNELAKISGQVLLTNWIKYIIMFYSATNTAVRTPIHLLTNGTFYFDDLSVVQTSLRSAWVDTTGDIIIVSFGWKIQNTLTSLNLSSLVVSVNGVGDAVKSVAMNGTSGLKLAVTNRIMPGDSVTLGYIDATGNLAYQSGAPSTTVTGFMDNAVDNLSKATNNALHPLSDKPAVVVSPNPVSGELRLMNVQNSSGISIANILGQKVIAINHLSGNVINVAGLDKGIYLLTINNADGTSYSLKFIKQ